MTVHQMGAYARGTSPGHAARGPGTRMGPSGDWIMGTLERRRQERGLIIEQMRRIRDAYNGDMVVPLPEMNSTEDSSVANLIVTGVDQTAQRIASVVPAIDFPPLKPGFKVSEDKAATRTLAARGWWEANRMPLKLRRRARWLVGYSCSPAVIVPDFNRRIPMWEIRDPLSAYPAPTQDPDDICPPNAIFTYFKSLDWLRVEWPVEALTMMNTWGAAGRSMPGHTQIELVQYVDADCVVLAVLGMKQQGHQWAESAGMNSTIYVELARVPNYAGECPAVIPGRITLERPRGQFDAQIGMYAMQARLMALEILAVERGVFPDTYLVSRQNETAQFISGPHDGRSGLVNVVKGGDIKEQSLNPGFATTNVIDRLERAQRVSGGIPSEYGGESPTNVRTGKRGDAVMSAVTSFPVQEAQEVLAAALEEENRRAVAIMKACFGRTKRSFYVNLRGTARAVEYIPNEVFEIDVNRVTYPMVGADMNGLVVGLGQRVGIGTMSKRTAAELDPMIGNPEQEHDRVTSEGLEAAVLASLQAQAQEGAIPPGDIARIAEIVTKGQGDLFEAIAQVQKEAQERQASSGEPGAPDGPVMPGAPEAQPGLAQPGQGQEVPTVGPPSEGLGNVTNFLQMLRQGGGQ